MYGYLALAHDELLFRSVFLLALGLLVLGYLFLAKMYFFRTPLRGVIVATVLYVFGLIVSQAGPGTCRHPLAGAKLPYFTLPHPISPSYLLSSGCAAPPA